MGVNFDKACPLSFHFSVDDVFESLIEVNDQGISLWDHPFFRFLKDLHKGYGLYVNLYLFLEGMVDGKLRRLEEIPSELYTDFNHAPWIRLGPHALAFDKAPYLQSDTENRLTLQRLYSQIDRLAGTSARSKWIRLHYFSEAFGSVPLMKSKGAEGLFLTDKEAVSYHLPSDLKDILRIKGKISYQGIELIRSHLRLENLIQFQYKPATLRSELDRFLDLYGYVILFTHEVDITRPEIQEFAWICFDHLASRKAVSVQ